MVLIIVSFSGCTDKPEEVQDEVNVYVYEQTGEEGDPQEQIREFYDMVDEQSGPPILVSLRKHAAEYDLDPEGNVIPDSVKIYDPDGNPVDRETALAMQDNIARDDAGNIITDAAQLDLQIEKIKENKYSGDTEFNDNIFIISDGLDDMCGGIVLDDNGMPHGIIVIDEDTWALYGGDFGTMARGENRPRGIDKEDCTHLGNGIYAYVVDLSETPEGSMSVISPYPTMEGLDITDKNGGYAQFRFVKEKS